MAVQNGQAIPSDAGAIEHAGLDGNYVGKIPIVDSKFGAMVRTSIGTYADGFSPQNIAYGSRGLSEARKTMPPSDGASTSNVLVADSSTTPTTAAVLNMVAGTDDSPSGIGAQSLSLVYWAIDGKRYTQTIIPNGSGTAQPITFNPPAFFIERFFVASAGSSGAAGSTGIVINTTDDLAGLTQIGGGENSIVETTVVTSSPTYIYSVTTTREFSPTIQNYLAYAVWDYTTSTVQLTATIDVFSSPASTESSLNIRYTPPVCVTTPPAGCVNLINWVTLFNSIYLSVNMLVLA